MTLKASVEARTTADPLGDDNKKSKGQQQEAEDNNEKQRTTTREDEAVNCAGSVFRGAVHDGCGRTRKKRQRRLIERWIS
jgi:hypothetical protein